MSVELSFINIVRKFKHKDYFDCILQMIGLMAILALFMGLASIMTLQAGVIHTSQ
jgi:hypothetical protein